VFSRVRSKWLIGCIFVCVGVFGCQPEPARPMYGGERCKDGLMLCICAGGEATGFIPCGANRITTECGGCSPFNPDAASGAAGSTAIGSGLGAAGSAPGSFAGSSAAPGVGAAGSGVQGAASAPASPPAAGGCAAGEVCRVTSQGSMKFCSRDPAATLPPVCSAPGQACGSNSLGTCTSGAAAGVPTALYCVYPAC
jgi:hypothetical protein